MDPDLILICESWCNSDITSAFLLIDGFVLITDLRRDRDDTRQGIGGGLLVYGKPYVKILPRETDNNFTQFCNFSIAVKDEKWEIFLVYRPPSSSEQNSDSLASLVRNCPDNSIFIGDFNLPGANWLTGTSDSKSRKFCDACSERGFEQIVDFPTHLRGNILDLVLTDRPDKISSVTSAGRLGRSDHEALLIEIDIWKPVKEKGEQVKMWGKADWEGMKEEMDQVDWRRQLASLNVEDAWSALKRRLEELTDKYVPVRPRREADRPPWMTVALLREVRAKRRLWAKFKSSPTGENQKNYKAAEKSIYKKIRLAKKQLERGIASNKDDKKKFYGYVRSKLRNRTGVGPLSVDGRPVVEEAEMAEALNSYFSSVFQEEDKNSVPLATDRKPTKKCPRIFFRPSAVKKVIQSLKTKTAPGPDGVTVGLLKGLGESVSLPLSLIFNKSMYTGEIPVDWRRANVTPIFKKGSKKEPSNYRPVSLTSIPGKIMERLLKENMMEHLSSNRLIKKSQHGFLPRKSCTTNLLQFLEKATSILDGGGNMDVIYLDFSKAFDLVPRERLLSKLRAHGFEEKIVRWIDSWLTGRKQRVVLNGHASSWRDVISGVPQGSILGPILFVIFIDDLEENIRKQLDLIVKFADDTKIGHRSDTPEDCQLLQEALDVLTGWSNDWGMKFNTDKCHVLHLGRTNRQHVYKMNGTNLAVTSCERDIGVLISSNLKVHEQCEKAARTAMTALGQILRGFTYKDRQILPNLFKQYVRPHLEFSVPAWSPQQKGDQDTLEAVQRKMVRSVTGLVGNSYEERLAELNMETLAERRNKLDLIQCYKIIHGVDNVERGDWFEMMEERQHRTRQTEGGLNLKGTRPRLEIRKQFFSQRMIDMWNNLPAATKGAKTVHEFRNKIKKNQS